MDYGASNVHNSHEENRFDAGYGHSRQFGHAFRDLAEQSYSHDECLGSLIQENQELRNRLDNMKEQTQFYSEKAQAHRQEREQLKQELQHLRGQMTSHTFLGRLFSTFLPSIVTTAIPSEDVLQELHETLGKLEAKLVDYERQNSILLSTNTDLQK